MQDQTYISVPKPPEFQSGPKVVKTVLHTKYYVYVYGNTVGLILHFFLVGEGRGEVVLVLLCLYVFQFVYHGSGGTKSQL